MRLSEQEHAMLTEAAKPLVGKSTVTALAAYGSKVAGYARPDSDYDIIVVAKRFGEGVRYKYIDEPFPLSALIVDEELLHDDASSSLLGEFVVGRLLNAYEPISNPEVFRKVELEYKKRIIVEALLELSSDYGDFSRHLIVPYDYFLFEKLSRRAAVYPPALYSYVQTYSTTFGGQNRASSSEGFAEAARSLAPREFLIAGADGVRMVPEKLRGDAFTKFQSMFSMTTRGLTQYAVHGYAGRVGLSVFTREAQSKLKRMRETTKRLPELDRPRMLLRLQEGSVIPDASLLEKSLAKLLGFSTYSTKERYLGDPASTVRVLTYRDGDREASVVVKNYADVRSLKWALLGIWASAANKYSTSPLARLDREYGMTVNLRASGLAIPAVLAVAPEERLIVKEFVSGPTLAAVIDDEVRGVSDGIAHVKEFAEVMSKVHKSGYALGDSKASNVIVSDRGLFLTDLEQAVPGGDKAWDIAVFLYYTCKLSQKEDEMRKVAEAFLSTYAGSGETANIGAAGNQKYYRPFRPFLTPGMAKMLREEMGRYA